jgi:ureidoacrylate peracid hydrolase
VARDYAGRLLPTGVQEKAVPRHTALVIVDMQNDFVHPRGYFGGSPALQAIVRPVQAVAEAARRVGVSVHFAQIAQDADGSTASDVWVCEALGKGYEPKQCIAGTWGARNVDELQPLPGDRVHVKRRRSAFRGTALEEELRSAGVRTVVIAGLAANGCVEYTAREAFEMDFHPVVVLDAIANAADDPGRSWRSHYAAFLPEENLVSSDELIAIWCS